MLDGFVVGVKIGFRGSVDGVIVTVVEWFEIVDIDRIIGVGVGGIVNVVRTYITVMVNRVMFGEIISLVVFSSFPVYIKLSLFLTIALTSYVYKLVPASPMG